MNRKRIWRLWKKEGLKVPPKKHKKQRLDEAASGVLRLQAAGMNCIWAMDFVFDVTANGRSLKWLAIVDEFTRECLALIALGCGDHMLESSRQRNANSTISISPP